MIGNSAESFLRHEGIPHVRAFLWNGQRNQESKDEHTAMEKVFEDVCIEKGVEWLLEETKPNHL